MYEYLPDQYRDYISLDSTNANAHFKFLNLITTL